MNRIKKIVAILNKHPWWMRGIYGLLAIALTVVLAPIWLPMAFGFFFWDSTFANIFEVHPTLRPPL